MDKNSLGTTETLEAVLRESVRRIASLKADGDGKLPVEIWELLFRLTNVCPTFEVVVAVFSQCSQKTQRDNPQFVGWALKQRDQDDYNWRGLYHAPGTVLRYHDTSDSIRKRLFCEIFGRPASHHDLIELPHVVREDIVREATCLSVLYLLKIPEDQFSELHGEWKIFSHDAIVHADATTIPDQIPLFESAYRHLR